MSAAAAQIERQLSPYLFFAGRRIAIKQSPRGDHHAIDAVAALSGLVIDKRLLDWVRVIKTAQPFKRNYLAARHSLDRYQTGARRHAVNKHGARPALTQATAILGAIQFQVIAQDVKQRSVGSHIQLMVGTIYIQGQSFGSHSRKVRVGFCEGSASTASPIPAQPGDTGHGMAE